MHFAGRFTSGICLAGIVLLAAALLSIGADRDYRLKHEDNNALHSTFARSHLELGLRETRAHDVYYSPGKQQTTWYGHHPPGVGLVLATVFAISGADSPLATRATAISFQLLSLFLLFRLVRHLTDSRTALLAAFFFAILPMGAFYGRMANHEILALPAIILMVHAYCNVISGRGSHQLAVLLIAATIGASFAWMTFFAIGGCMAHAGVEIKRGNPRGCKTFLWLSGASVALFTIDVLHIAFALQGDLSDLSRIFLERAGQGKNYSVLGWCMKMLSFSHRLLSAAGVVASVWVLARVLKGIAGRPSRRSEPGATRTLAEIASIFLVAGLSYCVVFNWGAWQHHYWQFILLPGASISLALAVAGLVGWATAGGRPLRYLLVVLVLTEIVATSVVGLVTRHSREDPFTTRFVERVQRDYL